MRPEMQIAMLAGEIFAGANKALLTGKQLRLWTLLKDSGFMNIPASCNVDVASQVATNGVVSVNHVELEFGLDSAVSTPRHVVVDANLEVTFPQFGHEDNGDGGSDPTLVAVLGHSALGDTDWVSAQVNRLSGLS